MNAYKKILGVATMCVAISTASFAMEVSITDKSWDGKTLPDGQQCNKFGGDAKTPPLKITDMPTGANLVVLSFSDTDAPSMDNGGHGVIAYAVNTDGDKLEIPSVPGHTYTLPEGFTMFQAHKGPNWDTEGAYMPPCSGGGKHNYTLKVEVVSMKGTEVSILGTDTLKLGVY